MFQNILFLFICLAVPSPHLASSFGSVELDEYSFDKIVSKFEATLVKFDVAFPYGDKHDAYVALAKETRDVEDLLVAEVGVKDYGEKDNEGLAKKYDASKENFPLVKLFVRGSDVPISFDDSKGFTIDTLRQFLRDNTALHLSLPGCLKEMDKLADKFMSANEKEKKQILKEVTELQNKLSKSNVASGKIYKTIMEKVIANGNKFVKTEIERVKKLLSGKLSEEKKKELGVRVNILHSFKQNEKQTKAEL